MLEPSKKLFDYKKFWAHRFGFAHELPMTMDEVEQLGWGNCDIILVTGDAYVDHPSFGMAVIGRVLEAQGFRVGIISQPDWQSADDFRKLGQPNLFFGVTGGNMDSMVNRYTSDKKVRSNDAYTADGKAGQRPDRAVNVYAHRCREAYKNVPVIIGGIEASLRRIAHYDYWSDKVRKSILLDSKADLLVYGNAERQIIEIAHRLANGETISNLKGIRGTVHAVKQIPADWLEKQATDFDTPGKRMLHVNPYQEQPACEQNSEQTDKQEKVIQFHRKIPNQQRQNTVIRIPDYDQVKDDPVLYAHASRVMHGETNPGNARALIQAHGSRLIWVNPTAIPLSTEEMDSVFDLPYSRLPHSSYKQANIPAFEMIQHSVNIMRGCFGGCTFCSITEHEGRIIQNRSEDSIIKEIERIRDVSPNFTGHISDLGGPTANMYRLACKDPKIEAACRRPSCVYPGICENLNTNHSPLIQLYRRARKLPGIKKIFIASGLRYDLAIESPEYVKELVTHHVGGYLKIAPEHTEQGPLSKMMKPGMGTYDRFKQMFDQYSKAAGKEQYLIPYFIAAHPGTKNVDMMNLALWLKKNGFRADQVQAFLPSPMSIATAMYHSGKNSLQKVNKRADDISIPKSVKQRRLHKAFLRYHDPKNWPVLREALKKMGRSDLIGNGKQHLVPNYQPSGKDTTSRHTKSKKFKTQHTVFNKQRQQKPSAKQSRRSG